jgi:hypothetical protein
MDSALRTGFDQFASAIEKEQKSPRKLTDAEIRAGLPPLSPWLLIGFFLVLPSVKKVLRQPWNPRHDDNNTNNYEAYRAESIDLVQRIDRAKASMAHISSFENWRRIIRIGWPWISNQLFALFVYEMTDAIRTHLTDEQRASKDAWEKLAARSPEFAQAALARNSTSYNAAFSAEADESDWT